MSENICANPKCNHTAWCHGNQSGFPYPGDPCHAAINEIGDECECIAYVHPPKPITVSLNRISPSDRILGFRAIQRKD